MLAFLLQNNNKHTYLEETIINTKYIFSNSCQNKDLQILLLKTVYIKNDQSTNLISMYTVMLLLTTKHPTPSLIAYYYNYSYN